MLEVQRTQITRRKTLGELGVRVPLWPKVAVAVGVIVVAILAVWGLMQTAGFTPYERYL